MKDYCVSCHEYREVKLYPVIKPIEPTAYVPLAQYQFGRLTNWQIEIRDQDFLTGGYCTRKYCEHCAILWKEQRMTHNEPHGKEK